MLGNNFAAAAVYRINLVLDMRQPAAEPFHRNNLMRGAAISNLRPKRNRPSLLERTLILPYWHSPNARVQLV